MQNFARRARVAIDALSFSTIVLSGTPASAPEAGCVITDLFLEGASWDKYAIVIESML
jgi:hypothetical protein